jgi:hypothetical protein
MLVQVAFITLGTATIVWARWLTPRWLGNVYDKNPRERESDVKYLSQHAVTQKLLTASALCGGFMILIGSLLLLAE